MKLSVKITVLLILNVFCLTAQEKLSNISFNGQLTTWGIFQLENSFPLQFGGRFVPTVLGDFQLGENSKIDYEASANINGSLSLTRMRVDTLMGQVKPYRVWARYSGQNWEVRAGLQKINFGQAKMFRPLMWFDAMDVRDPLQLTDGVYGVLGKYFFQNNANVWAWGLIGNKNRKGYEFFGTDQWKPEMGGRIQTPLGTGEIAVSTNYRKVKAYNLLSSRWNDYSLLNESRIGLDGKWDIGIGLWFESSITLTELRGLNLPFVSKVQDMWNVGADYTLPVGNGLGVTIEYFKYHAGNQLLVNGTSLDVLGTMLTYPLSLLDNLSGMVFYLPGQNKWMNYLSWSRTYDNLNFYAIAYWNPTDMQLITSQSQSNNLFAGKGLQLMINYNF